jgi:hypothetical protein
MMTMTHLGNIRESDIQTAVSMADLDAACAYLQDMADIGGIAALAISDVNFDWSAVNQGERIRSWLKLEAIHTASLRANM